MPSTTTRHRREAHDTAGDTHGSDYHHTYNGSDPTPYCAKRRPRFACDAHRSSSRHLQGDRWGHGTRTYSPPARLTMPSHARSALRLAGKGRSGSAEFTDSTGASLMTDLR